MVVEKNVNKSSTSIQIDQMSTLLKLNWLKFSWNEKLTDKTFRNITSNTFPNLYKLINVAYTIFTNSTTCEKRLLLCGVWKIDYTQQ